jgi:hypothetical protein
MMEDSMSRRPFVLVVLAVLLAVVPGHTEGKKHKIFRKNPTLGAKGLETTAQVLDADSLDRSIGDLLSLLEIEDESEKPKILEQLAEIYWEKSQYYYNLAYGDDIIHRLRVAMDKNDKAAEEKVKAEQKKLLKQRGYWQQQAINVYKSIVAKYPTYPNLDKTLYYLVYTLVMMDRLRLM